MQAGGRRFDPVWLHQTVARDRPSREEQQFPPLSASGGYLDIVKKGYARDVDSRQRSMCWFLRVGLLPRRLSSSEAVRCKRDRRLANRKPSVRVYLDATGLSIGGVHRAEKEQETGSRLQSAGDDRLSQVGIANESDQVT